MTSGIIEILIGNAQVQAIELIASTEQVGIFKVFPIVCPQGETEPFITVLKTGNTPTLSKDCFSTLDTSNYEVRSWSKKGFVKTEDMSETCRRALETGSDVVTQACTFKKIWMTNDYDHYDEESDMFCHIGLYTAFVVRSLT